MYVEKWICLLHEAMIGAYSRNCIAYAEKKNLQPKWKNGKCRSEVYIKVESKWFPCCHIYSSWNIITFLFRVHEDWPSSRAQQPVTTAIYHFLFFAYFWMILISLPTCALAHPYILRWFQLHYFTIITRNFSCSNFSPFSNQDPKMQV